MAASDRQPEPQFPAPTAGAEEAVPAVERLPAPVGRARQLIAAHLRDEHDVKRFELARFVHLGGLRTRSQVITWLPAKASFLCEHCPGIVFTTGEITDEMLAIAEAFDETLQPLLVGLTDPEDRKQMLRLQRDGTLNRLQLALANEAAYRESAAALRPGVQARRSRLQGWMLERFEQTGHVARVVAEAAALQTTDPALWAELVGRPLVESTIRSEYWNRIPIERRRAASERFKALGQTRKRLT